MANPENKQIPYESTQKDIRDAIESVATAIGGITHPDAEDIVYDNSVSGLSATDVQNAIDELSSEKADSSSLATVATSGDYDDLINKPTIPTVNDATLTIQKNGSDVATFTANASSNVVANVTVPTTTSELTNNSDFVSDASYVHTDNNFTNAEKTKLGGIESGAEVNVQSDWSQSDNTADDYIKNKPSSEVKTATNTFITVNGGLLEECNIDLVPVQDLHGYPNPWPGGAGKNLLDADDVYNLTNDYIFGSATTTKKISLSAGTYTYSFNVIGTPSSNAQAIIRDFTSGTPTRLKIQNIVTGRNEFVFTTETPITDITSFCNSTNAVDITELQIEKSNSFTSYEPYSNICPISGHTEVDLDVKDGDNVTQHTYQVQIGSTVYGGTVDLVSGVMNVTHKYIEYDGSNDEGWLTSESRSRAYISVSDIDISIEDSSVADIISNEYKTVSYSDGFTTTDGITGRYNISQINVFDRTNINSTTTLAQWLTYLSSHPLKVCYKLATPLTIQLTPQQIEALVGQNNLSTPLDGQSIQTNGVKYREVFAFDDVEKVVSLRVPISMLGTDESGRTTASQAYASGDYFYKDGYMCKALTSISAGATLTLNTNYSQGTLADILKAIENA